MPPIIHVSKSANRTCTIFEAAQILGCAIGSGWRDLEDYKRLVSAKLYPSHTLTVHLPELSQADALDV